MDQRANDTLSQLQERLRQESLVKGIDDLRVGDIIYYDMDRADGITPKDGYDTRLKYVVVAGAKSNAKEVCAVLINSENDHSPAADWQAEQYLIRQVDYPGILEYDSWIDCTDPKELKVAKIKAKDAEKKGHLNANDLANVMKHLKENDFVDSHTRKVYGIDQYEIDGEQLLGLMETNRQAMIARNEPEMTLDEINAEIAAARAESKARIAKETAGV